jgi:N utilization substance protein A
MFLSCPLKVVEPGTGECGEMSKELCFVIDQISREKGMSREAIMEVLESALLSAAKKRYANKPSLAVKIDRKTCVIRVFEEKRVVESVTDPNEEVSLDEARRNSPEKAVGDTVEFPIPVHDFGRIAAQTAKQVIFQKVREAERDIIYDEYKDKVRHIISGTVVRREKGFYFVHLGKTEALLPIRDSLPNESLKRGDIIKAYLSEVRQTARGPALMLSRTDPEFVKSLFTM